jgi:hypothetical protein
MDAAGDFDGDGRLDLAIIDEEKRAAYVIWGTGAASGPDAAFDALAVPDLNRDGWPDRGGLCGDAGVGVLQYRPAQFPRSPLE